jgi:Mrp family chromosome partitioning ATPase
VTQQLDSSQLLSLLDSSKLLVVCGSGGVGKTTMSAALGALAATHLHKKVLVLTVDPARRLADALGLQAIGNAVVQVDAKAFNEAGVVPQGQLFAARPVGTTSFTDMHPLRQLRSVFLRMRCTPTSPNVLYTVTTT